MRYWLFSVLLLFSFGIAATEQDSVQGLENLIHEFVTQDTPQSEWKQYVKTARETETQWESDHQESGSMKAFLDERLLVLAMAANKGECEKVKNFGRWMALYVEFGEPLPEYIHQFASDHWTGIEALRKDGATWENLTRLLMEKPDSAAPVSAIDTTPNVTETTYVVKRVH